MDHDLSHRQKPRSHLFNLLKDRHILSTKKKIRSTLSSKKLERDECTESMFLLLRYFHRGLQFGANRIDAGHHFITELPSAVPLVGCSRIPRGDQLANSEHSRALAAHRDHLWMRPGIGNTLNPTLGFTN